jgi:hypothetical protein
MRMTDLLARDDEGEDEPEQGQGLGEAMPRNMVVRTMPADSGWRAWP